MKKKSEKTGFTLAEAMVAVVVLGIAAAGVLMPFTAGARSRMEGQRRTLAAKLASDLIEKIVATDFNDITTAYGSYSEEEGQIEDMTGTVFADPMYAGFGRTAKCEPVYVKPESGYYDSESDKEPVFIWAKVSVNYNGGEFASVSRLISK